MVVPLVDQLEYDLIAVERPAIMRHRTDEDIRWVVLSLNDQELGSSNLITCYTTLFNAAEHCSCAARELPEKHI